MEEMPGSAGCGCRQMIRSIRQGLLAKGAEEPLARPCTGSGGLFYHGPALLSRVNANPALCLTIQIANRDTGRASSDFHGQAAGDFSAIQFKASLASYYCGDKIRGAGALSCHFSSRAQHLFRADGTDARGDSTRRAWRGDVPTCMCPGGLAYHLDRSAAEGGLRSEGLARAMAARARDVSPRARAAQNRLSSSAGCRGPVQANSGA